MKARFCVLPVILFFHFHISNLYSQQKDFGKARIVYSTKEMNDVVVKKGIKYLETATYSLTLDIYYPPNKDKTTQLPAVIFVFGYPDSVIQKNLGTKLKEMGQYVSWASLIASSGMIAITYETVNPEETIKQLIKFVRANSIQLMIDPDRICFWSCSGNVPTALSLFTSQSNEYLKCAVLYYGFMIEPSGESKVEGLAKKVGFVYPEILKNPSLLRWDIPTLVVKAGKDNVPNIQPTIDSFVMLALSHNSPIELINYSNGQHAFDILDDNDASREIIKHTIEFIKYHLQSIKE